MKTVLNMDHTRTEADDEAPQTLPAHAAMITAANRLNGVPHKGWYFAVMVRAAYSRLGGLA